MLLSMRRGLLGLLLLAIPFQGFAAASMAGRAPDQHGAPARLVALATATATATPAQPVDSAHHHGSFAAAVDVDRDVDVDVDVEAEPIGDQADYCADHRADHAENHAAASTAHGDGDGDACSTCTVCASCCAAFALPTTAFVFVPAVPVAQPHAWFSIGRVGFVTGGPERPPRISCS